MRPMVRESPICAKVERKGSVRAGPVVRINPYEVHIYDADFYDELYVGSTKAKTDKWYWSVSRALLSTHINRLT